MTAPARLRFAPSPNGYLHLGHAYSALMNARIAEHLGGTLLLRFEDIDTVRCRPEYMEAALEDLAWLGLRWQEPVWRQSERFPVYAAALERLKAEGLVYPCFCSRGDIARAIAGRPDWPRDPDGSPVYPGTCRHFSNAERSERTAAGQRPAWRLDMSAALKRLPPGLCWTEFSETAAPSRVTVCAGSWGDALLARRDIATSYHVAVVVDDAAQGVTNVVRGEDLRAATSLHRVLQVLLGFSAPAYHHHRLIVAPDGRKLSKSAKAAPLRDLSRDEVFARLDAAGLPSRPAIMTKRNDLNDFAESVSGRPPLSIDDLAPSRRLFKSNAIILTRR